MMASQGFKLNQKHTLLTVVKSQPEPKPVPDHAKLAQNKDTIQVQLGPIIDLESKKKELEEITIQAWTYEGTENEKRTRQSEIIKEPNNQK